MGKAANCAVWRAKFDLDFVAPAGIRGVVSVLHGLGRRALVWGWCRYVCLLLRCNDCAESLMFSCDALQDVVLVWIISIAANTTLHGSTAPCAVRRRRGSVVEQCGWSSVVSLSGSINTISCAKHLGACSMANVCKQRELTEAVQRRSEALQKCPRGIDSAIARNGDAQVFQRLVTACRRSSRCA